MSIERREPTLEELPGGKVVLLLDTTAPTKKMISQQFLPPFVSLSALWLLLLSARITNASFLFLNKNKHPNQGRSKNNQQVQPLSSSFSSSSSSFWIQPILAPQVSFSVVSLKVRQRQAWWWALQSGSSSSSSDSTNQDNERREENEEEEEEEKIQETFKVNQPVVGPEKSRMIDFIADYLDKNNSNNNNNNNNNINGENQNDRAVVEMEKDSSSTSFVVTESINDKATTSTTSATATTSGSPTTTSSTSTTVPSTPTMIREGATHLIAIPMDTCHELLIELESVQRAILYHCPILVHACIVPTNTRLPLLYVQTPPSRNAASATSQLADLVRTLVDKHMFEAQRVVTSSSSSSSSEDARNLPWSSSTANTKNDNNNNHNNNDQWANRDGIHPFTMTFQSLEVDGPNNNILNTVAVPNDDGTRILQDFLDDLIQQVQALGWKAALPWDPNHPQQEQQQSTTNTDTTYTNQQQPALSFRPRIPFMELPQELNDNIEKFKNGTLEITDETIQSLTSDQGGNGISPIFWAQWWDDVLGRSIRLPAVGIYPRQSDQHRSIFAASEPGGGLFYLPHETIDLPEGNATMQASEAKFQKYQDDRMEEEQVRQYKEKLQQEQQTQQLRLQENSNDEDDEDDEGRGPISSRSGMNAVDPYATPDILISKTRERLEALYLNSSVVDVSLPGLMDEEMVEMPLSMKKNDTGTKATMDALKENDSESEDENDEKDWNSNIKVSPDDFLEDWARQRIQKVTEKLKELEKKKDNPPIEDNPVFLKYKDGTLVPKAQQQQQQPSLSQASKELPPFPSREHFIGIWRVVTSPTGFVNEELSEDRSENLVLRVDGTTAGGPILDQETNQKAAGGTWTMLLDDDDDDNNNYSNKNARLRIRLVIPPKKERILILEGQVSRMDTSSSMPMTSKAFGIPELEARAKLNMKGLEDMIYCAGEVSVRA
jgi:hypothetical protein